MKKTLILVFILGLSFFIGYQIKNYSNDESKLLNNNNVNKLNKNTLFSNVIHTYRTKTCFCCKKWINYLRVKNVHVEDHVVEYSDMEKMRNALKIPKNLYSCHFAQFNGYHLEGHLPIAVIKYIDKNKPKWTAIALPGMPLGSPGMELPENQDDVDDKYKVYEVMAYSKLDQSVFPFMKFKGRKLLKIN